MALMNEYINRKLSGSDLQSELLELISKYNKLRSTYLLVYAAAIGKPIPDVQLAQADFYVIHDFLVDKRGLQKIDVYIETPGGSGEAAEEIVRCLHNNFETVSFVVSGEAKSAGTIIVLSGNEILMTETGSLGPIDAQMKIGRSVVSAYDYMEWIDGKREEAQKQGALNPFDATIVAQITPGELGNVFHALEFAKDLVEDWLIKYKFKKWKVTETRKMSVTEEMKRKRAKEIASELTNHSKWRLHGRSIKIDDLAEIGLKVTRAEDDLKLSDIIYRIQTVCRLLFDSTTTYKIFATEDKKMFRQAVQVGAPIRMPTKKSVDAVEIGQKCPKCGTVHKLYAKFEPDPQIDIDLKKKGFKPFPKDAKLKCNCGFEIDLSGIKNQIEIQSGSKIIV
ncbi:MAG: ATP-dependent Clp protease proteolytic subunit [Candidatus Aminicenantes bacterium]|nr:ATP-dependent Clp protease proteolytic subunit [Candidatus Aminicenantes bacterium]